MKALTELVKDLLEEAADGEEKVEAEKDRIHKIAEALPYMQLSLEGWGGDVLEEKFNSPLWEKLYRPCLACGTCTFVCPTCQCYDIKDYDTGHGIQQIPLLGFVYVFRLYPDGTRKQPYEPDAAFPSEIYAQAGLFPGKQRRHVFLYRLWPLRGKMSAVPEYCEGDQSICGAGRKNE